MNSLITDTYQTDVKYLVKVNGVVRSAALPRTLAESAIKTLPLKEQPYATLVPVTDGGKEILLG